MAVYGYARISTDDQDHRQQIDALLEAGVAKKNIIDEVGSGKNMSQRPRYTALLERLESGDKLVVMRVDRLGRNVLEALQTVKDLDERGVNIVITSLGIDLKTASGRLVFGVLCQVAEFERTLIHDRIRSGIASAKARNVVFGRKRTLTAHQRTEAVKLRAEGKSFAEIAALYGCGRTVVHRAVTEAQPG